MTRRGEPWRLVCLYLYGSNSGLLTRFGKVSQSKFMVTTLGQRTTAPSWEQNSTWADASIPSVSPLAFAPRSRKKSLQFYLLNLSRATSETLLHYTVVFEKKIHEIFINQDEQRVLLIIVWTSIAVRLVKHDPWSSPASDVTMHDVVLHSSHSLWLSDPYSCGFGFVCQWWLLSSSFKCGYVAFDLFFPFPKSNSASQYANDYWQRPTSIVDLTAREPFRIFTFAKHVSFEHSTGIPCPMISSRREGNINKQTKLKSFLTLDRWSVSPHRPACVRALRG